MTDEALLSWIRSGQILAAFLVAVGVAGEFVGEFGARRLERRLETARQLELAHMQERAAVAERSLLELQERARPRTIDPTARALIVEQLTFGQHPNPVTITFISSTPEPGQFAEALSAMLKEAGWIVAGVDGGPMLGTPPTGLVVHVSEISRVEDQGRSLSKALNAGGLNSVFAKRPPDSMKPDMIELLVGLKP